MVDPVIPPPAERLSADTYLAVRDWLIEHDPDGQRFLQWSREETGPPQSPEAMAGEIIWIILCAGRSGKAASTLMRKVRAAIHDGRPVVEAFGYRAKAAAIERAWNDRRSDFSELQAVLASSDVDRLLAWCRALPFVGETTQYQLAKNFGVQCAKPDIWMCRLCGIPDKPRLPLKVRFHACMELCSMLASATGDSIATIDSMLWLGCNKGVLVTDGSARPIAVNLTPRTLESIHEGAVEPASPEAGQLTLDI
ncbi:hypothetical protein [Burkholderia sp. Ac-20365]|uniref:hypothetical protein n=1 Tax=Burkholderia sp. Ac-20365 TaxID=2703897 RepID=UPI00197C8651|nr:hypothetical protein [Burkholderia sp. Ac-20365]MBN3761197.1 hypothetical protein [Burkholderia sp. Ac-20365]